RGNFCQAKRAAKLQEKMSIAIAADHAGFELKQLLADFLRQQGHTVNDLGTHSTDPVDYPDFAQTLALNIVQGDCERGILICGSGVGASVAANKFPGI